MENAYNIHQAYIMSMAKHTKSIVPISGYVADILTIFFGPLFFRPLMGGDLNGNIFYNLYYFVLPIVYIMLVQSIMFVRSRIFRAPALTLLLTFLIYPQHSTLKMTWLLPSLALTLPFFLQFLKRPWKIRLTSKDRV